MSDEAFREFLNEAEKYPLMWDSFELKAVGATKNESLYLLGLSCTLSVALHPTHEILFQTPDLLIVKEAKALTELQSIINSVSSGSVTVAGHTFIIDGFTNYECRIWGGSGQGWLDILYPYILLQYVGKPVREVIDESSLHRELEQWGYRCIWDLTQEKIGFQVGGAYSTQMRFVAPIFVEASGAFVNDNLRLVLRCSPSLKTDDLSAGYEVALNYFGNRQTERGRLDFLDATRIEDGVSFTLVKELPLLPQAESTVAWLFHSSRADPLYTLRIIKPATVRTNPVWGAMGLALSRQSGGQLLSARQILEESLGLMGEVRDSGRFEAAVHNMLSCMGYMCIFTGREWGTQGIDTLAFAPELDRVLAASMTVANNIGEKIRTMLPKLQELKTNLEGISVLPVIIAAVSPDVVLHSDHEDAKAHGIVLVLKPELEQILEAISTLPLDEARQRWDSIIESSNSGRAPNIL